MLRVVLVNHYVTLDIEINILVPICKNSPIFSVVGQEMGEKGSEMNF
jgi:hypothetical protein